MIPTTIKVMMIQAYVDQKLTWKTSINVCHETFASGILIKSPLPAVKIPLAKSTTYTKSIINSSREKKLRNKRISILKF